MESIKYSRNQILILAESARGGKVRAIIGKRT